MHSHRVYVGVSFAVLILRSTTTQNRVAQVLHIDLVKPAADNPHFEHGYNTAAENYLIPLAADKGVGVIINRPFESGSLFDTVSTTNLPSWAGDWGITTWAAFFLKYLISNVNISCTIPATSQVNHLEENMAASLEPLPDGVTRKKMVEFYKNNVK